VSLVEVCAALFVLSIGALCLAGSMAQSHTLVERPREEYAAWSAIRNAEANLLSVSFADVASTFHLTGFDVPGLEAPPDDPDGKPGEILFDYGPGGDTRYYRVTLRVRWKGIGGVRQVERDVFLANFRGDTGTPQPLSAIPGGGSSGPVAG